MTSLTSFPLFGQATGDISISRSSPYLSGVFSRANLAFGTLLLILVSSYEVSDGLFKDQAFIACALTRTLLLVAVITASAEFVSEFFFDASP